MPLFAFPKWKSNCKCIAVFVGGSEIGWTNASVKRYTRMQGRRNIDGAYTSRLLESKRVSSRGGGSIHGALRDERAARTSLSCFLKIKMDIVMAGRLQRDRDDDHFRFAYISTQ